MTESVEANFTITRDEYVRAMRRYYKNKLQWKRDLVGGIVALGAGIYCLQTSTLLPALAWLLVLAGCFMLTLLMYAIFLLPHMIYRSQPKLKSEYRLRFRDEGIGFQTDDIDAQLKWTIYHSWMRNAEFYLLYQGKRDVSVIPRRAIKDDADKNLGELLRKHIGAEGGS